MQQSIRALVFLIIGCLMSGTVLAQSPQSTPDILSPNRDKDHGTWCTGDVLLDQPPNLSFSLWSESTCDDCGADAQVLAEDFTFERDSLVTEVVIWGWYFPTNTPPPLETWTIRFHQDGNNSTGNVPSGLISSQTVVPVSRTATGRTAEILGVTVDEVRWVLRLPEPVALPGVLGLFNWIEAFHDSPTVAANTSIGYADLDPVHGGVGFGQAFTAPGDEWSRVEDVHLAMQICGVRSEWNGLMVPGYQIDTTTPGGATSFLAIRNTANGPTDINVAYYGEDLDAGPLRVDPVSLAPRQTYTHNLRANLSGLDPDADGTASGFVVVTESGGGAKNLTGDVLRVDFANDFATGERLLAFDDFCPEQEIRFVDFGSGSEFNVVLRDPPSSGAAMTVTVLDEAGNQLSQVNVADGRQVQRIPITDLINNQSFGTLVFDFSASHGGVVTGSYSAFGRFSTELRGACRR